MTPEQVEAWLARWPDAEGGRASLVNLSENHTFRIDRPGRPPVFLRVHRPGYQSAATIESELFWLGALRQDTELPVPRALAGHDSRVLQQIGEGSAARHAVLFAGEAGNEPSAEASLTGLFRTLGGFAAMAHSHAVRFVPPPRFTRPFWSAEAILDAGGLWGDWRAAPHVTGPVAATLAELDRKLRVDLETYGIGADRFGLIHADMRLANLLVDGDRLTLIDFDDCGFGWFMYDFAAAVSFHENSPEAPDWRAAWLDGYQAVRPLADADIAIIDTMVLLRRMALLAWIASHHETDLSRSHADRFAEVTAELAERYLSRP